MENRLSGLVDAMKKARDRMRREGEEAFREAIADVFREHPKLEGFSWTQYTPYFNDGEPCEFSVDEMRTFAFDGEVWDEDPEWCLRDKPEDDPALKAAEACGQIVECLQSLEDIALFAFGDHVKVIVSRNEGGPTVSTESYDHD